MVTTATPLTVARDAAWLAHRYDPGHDAVHFIHADRAARARATFLTDEYLVPGGDPVVIRRAEALAATSPPAPVHFIFHSAFCCSTLLARAFDLPGLAVPLKEPTILNDITGWRYRGGSGAEVARAADGALALLARPFGPGEAVIVKPSNIANGMADLMLALRPQATALLLHAPLSVYLRSIAKKGLDGRLWVRDLMAKLLRERLIDLGLDGEDYLRLTDLQAAAVGWLAQHALFARLAVKYGSRVRTLDSETLMERPREAIGALSALYGLSLTSEQLNDIVSGPAFTTHSKHGSGFDPAAREAEYAAAADAHGDEIAKVEVWAGVLAEQFGIAMVLPSALLVA